MSEALNEVLTTVLEYLPNLAGAVLILVLGWLLALALAAGVRRILKHTELDKKLVKWLADAERAESINVERVCGKVVFYLVLILVFVAFLQALGLTLATEPLNEMLRGVLVYAPRLVGAGLLILLAWMVATLTRALVGKVGTAAKLDQRLADDEQKTEMPVSKTLADVVYWLILVLFIPAVAGALGLEGAIEPFRNAADRFLTYLPNLFGGALILIGGWLGARILQRLTSRLFAALGTDGLSEETGMKKIFGKEKLSDTLGVIVYVLALIPVLIATLNALQLDAVTEPASNMLNLMLQALPAIFAAGLILLISYVVARVVCGLVGDLLRGIGFDHLPARIGIWHEPEEGEKTPSEIVGWIALVIIMLFAAIEAASVLGFAEVGQLVTELTVIVGRILFGLVIFAVGLWLANIAGLSIRGSKLQQAGLVAITAKVAILGLTGAVALRQMGIANEIIVLAFGLLLGAIAVAAAISFGIGGRDVAARKLEEWTQNKPQ